MKLLELYTSVQGEGPNVGVPTTFVRFAGCNMRCPGWPCDTPYAIFPEQWRHEFTKVTPHELVELIEQKYPKNICITGGEPLIQPKDEIRSMVGQLVKAGYTIDLFSNGSRNFEEYQMTRPEVTIIMDWKLTGSGEGDSFLEERNANRLRLADTDAIKFVVAHKQDFDEALSEWKAWGTVHHRVYFAPAWNILTPARLVSWIEESTLEDAWLNLQSHKYIWNPQSRGI